MRKTIAQFGILGFLTVSLVGCSTPDNRYRTETGLDLGYPQPLALDVSSIPAPASPTNTTNTTNTTNNLPERAEAAYINGLAAKIKDATAFENAVTKQPHSSGITFQTSLTRILLITVSQQRYYPADRVVFMRVTIKPDQFAFSGLTASATSWASQSIDTLDVSNDVKFQPELDATLAGSVKGTFKGPVSVDHSTDVKANTTEVYEQLSANINSQGQLILVGTGARGIDIVGTSLAKLSFVPSPGENSDVVTYVDADNFTVLTGSTWLSPDKAKITLNFVKGLKPIFYTASADLIYTVRHVFGEGIQSYREDDDDVQYLTIDEKCTGLTLATPQDTGLATWSIFDNSGDLLEISTPLGRRQPIFTNYNSAAQFAAWISIMSPKLIGGWSLSLQPVGDSSLILPITKNHQYSALPTENLQGVTPQASSCTTTPVDYKS